MVNQPVVANIFTALPFSEIPLVLVRLDDVASVIVNADYSMMLAVLRFFFCERFKCPLQRLSFRPALR
jgi:hypothetical protein